MRSRPSGKPTITDVARRAGVSKSLVSLVMRDAPHVSAPRRQAVLKAVSELGYRPNAMAQGLVQRRTRLIGVMVSHLHNPFWADVVAGVDEQAARAGYRVLFNTGNRVVAQEDRAIRSLLELRVDGLVLAGTLAESRLMVEAAAEVPVVLVGRVARSGALDSVSNDDYAGGVLVVEHCASLGHRRIAHIDGGHGAGALERRRGYLEAMRRLRLGAHALCVAGTYTEEGGHAGALRLLELEPRPTAIFAANDLAALGALDALEERGLRVPDDVSLVGYDNTSLAALRHVSLTTVHQPRLEMGQIAVSTLLERLEEGRRKPRRAMLSPRLVVRRTTAPPAAERRTRTNRDRRT
ncbi:MAG: LacI family DNA-binding transcriptional regulator [Vicinamibacteria bacterium]